jgi:hypothetical protein
LGWLDAYGWQRRRADSRCHLTRSRRPKPGRVCGHIPSHKRAAAPRRKTLKPLRSKPTPGPLGWLRVPVGVVSKSATASRPCFCACSTAVVPSSPTTRGSTPFARNSSANSNAWSSSSARAKKGDAGSSVLLASVGSSLSSSRKRAMLPIAAALCMSGPTEAQHVSARPGVRSFGRGLSPTLPMLEPRQSNVRQVPSDHLLPKMSP